MQINYSQGDRHVPNVMQAYNSNNALDIVYYSPEVKANECPELF